MFGAILKATNSSFQKGIPFCRTIYVKKVMKLLAFIFEQPSYYNFVVVVAFVSLMSQCMRFPTMWHFDMCRLGQASAASF